VYIHQLSYDTDLKQLSINSRLQPITEQIAEDPNVAELVKEWLEKGFNAFRSNGFEPDAVVTNTTQALDGLEISVRNYPTTLTQAIAQGMVENTEGAQIGIFNSGSIRIDDVLPPGIITQYDVIRIMPFGGQVLLVEIKGSLLEKILNQGLANKGTGGYLHTANISLNNQGNGWLINNQPLNYDQNYPVAINDFLLTGREIALDYLTLENPEIQLISQGEDIRFTFIKHLENQSQ
jgi:5'-nucleotidase